MQTEDLRQALDALGELLDRQGIVERLIVVGGTSLSLLGWVQRATDDVDVIARALRTDDLPDGHGTGEHEGLELVRPDPLPAVLIEAIRRVARDFGLSDNWLNTEVAMQWLTGLPPGLLEGVTWREHGGLQLGLAGREVMIAMKLFAAVDAGRRSVHYQDLVALRPTREELDVAARWVSTQDASEVFPGLLSDLMTCLTQDLSRSQR